GADRGPAWLKEFHAKRERQIADEFSDPLQFGWESPPMAILRALVAGTYKPGMIGTAVAVADWKQTEPANDVLALGGNGSGKTDCEAKMAMEDLVSKPNREARCFSQNEMTSVRYIQRA